MLNLKKEAPNLPGVYIFKDADSKPIYIGKAKSLKKRINSYFKSNNRDLKIVELIRESDDIEYIITKSEQEALLLEAELIKTFKPKYNILLKYTNFFVFLVITTEKQGLFPELKIVYNKKQEGIYFGPFTQRKQINQLHNYLERTLCIRLCSNKKHLNKHLLGNFETGCLNYHLGICPGSCFTSFDKENYLFKIGLAKELLTNNIKKTSNILKKQILFYNKNLEFEKSANLTEILNSLPEIFQMIKNKFSIVHYNQDITSLALPISYKIEQYNRALISVQNLLNLPNKPISIDCFDISHFQSSYLVGSCVRFTNGLPEKKYFRRFQIKTIIEQNDYAALKEIVNRRYSGDKNLNSLPDLILIDGGKGQLNGVKNLFPGTPFISLAKKEEIVFFTKPDYSGSLDNNNNLGWVKLDLNTEIGQLLIAIRDYAHHFAISYHRFKRNQDLYTRKY